jgi:hypothetical protein
MRPSRGSKAIEISSRYSREVADLRGTDMLVRRGGMPLAFAFVTLFAQNAQAFFDPPWVAPENPLVGNAIAVNLRGGICDSIGEREGFPQITQQGNAIRLVEYGAHLSSGDPLCLFGNWTFARPIGSYPPGAYTVTVDLAYTHPVFGLTILTIGVVPFTVSAPPEPVSVPTGSPFGMTLLLSALLAAALLALKRDRFLRHVATPLLLAFIALFAQSAQAFFDPPWITPTHPAAGENMSVHVRGGVCDIFLGRDGYPKITRDGNAIRIAIFGAHYERGDELCVFPQVWTATRPIGAFLPGDYTLTVDMVYEDQFTGRPEIRNIGVVPFSVSAAPEPVSVPMGSPLGMALLLATLLAAALLALKRDRFLRRIAMPLAPAFVSLFAQSAQAFFDPPWIIPQNPVAGETISVNIRGGICDIFLEENSFPRITQEGNAIRIIIYGAHYEPRDELCVFPVWTGTRTIGIFSDGNYTLAVDLAYEHPVFGPSILNIGVVPFTVTVPPEPVSVPTGSPFGMTLLLSALLAAALLALRRDRFLRHVATPLLLAFIALFAQSAQAFFDPPWITPENPVAGESISVNIYGGICDWIAGREGFPQITQDGNSIRILEYGHHYEPGDELCIDGIGTVVDAIGAFPPGDYTLTVDLLYPHPVFGATILNIGAVSFTVAPLPAPVSVPATGWLSTSLLLAALLLAAIWTLCTRRGAPLLLLLVLPLGARAHPPHRRAYPAPGPSCATPPCAAAGRSVFAPAGARLAQRTQLSASPVRSRR